MFAVRPGTRGGAIFWQAGRPRTVPQSRAFFREIKGKKLTIGDALHCTEHQYRLSAEDLMATDWVPDAEMIEKLTSGRWTEAA